MNFKKTIFFLVLITLVFFLSACRVKFDDVTIKCNELTGECTVTGLDDDEPTINNGGGSIEPYDPGEYTVGKWTYYDKASATDFNHRNAFPFAEYVPSGSKEGLPLVIWLHGSGEGPSDCDKSCFLTKSIVFPEIINNLVKEDKFRVPVIMIAPHGHSANKVKAIIEYAKAKYNINENKIVLMGHSQGGNAVINYSDAIYKEMGQEQYFSALVVMSGTQSDYNVNYNYFRLMPMLGRTEARGYAGAQGVSSKKFFVDTGHELDYKDYGRVDHGDIPRRVMNEDDNGNNIPDVLDWALSKNRNEISLP